MRARRAAPPGDACSAIFSFNSSGSDEKEGDISPIVDDSFKVARLAEGRRRESHALMRGCYRN